MLSLLQEHLYFHWILLPIVPNESSLASFPQVSGLYIFLSVFAFQILQNLYFLLFAGGHRPVALTLSDVFPLLFAILLSISQPQLNDSLRMSSPPLLVSQALPFQPHVLSQFQTPLSPNVSSQLNFFLSKLALKKFLLLNEFLHQIVSIFLLLPSASVEK